MYIHSECAMGKLGWNVNQAREIPGVVSIDYSPMFTIRAEASRCICTSVLPTLVGTDQE